MGNHKRTILCVEDDPGVSLLIATSLAVLNYEVVNAFTFTEGINQILARGFDLYIINSGLPDGIGTELCNHIRIINSEAPIMFTTACANPDEFSNINDLSFIYFLHKPFKLDQLTEFVTRLLS
jgi:two-component system, OmpR family, response regulator